MARPHDEHGRFVSTACPDENCDGHLVRERDDWWRCDGLTYRDDNGPLFACEEIHLSGKSPFAKLLKLEGV